MPLYNPLTPATIGFDGIPRPSDHGLIAWSCDPAITTGSALMGTAGVVQTVRVPLSAPKSITNVIFVVTAAGVTLTSGQNFAGIYQAGSLIGATADQAAAWVSQGTKTMALSGGPFTVSAGDLIIAFFSNGSTVPSLRTGLTTSLGSINVGQAATASSFGTADTGRTTTFAGTLGTIAAANNSFWAGVS